MNARLDLILTRMQIFLMKVWLLRRAVSPTAPTFPKDLAQNVLLTVYGIIMLLNIFKVLQRQFRW
jgi:hypothetical protein